MIPRKAVEAIHSAICEESLEDHMDPQWPGRCVKAAQAAAPRMMAQAWDASAEEAESSGWMHEAGAADTKARNPYRKGKR